MTGREHEVAYYYTQQQGVLKRESINADALNDLTTFRHARTLADARLLVTEDLRPLTVHGKDDPSARKEEPHFALRAEPAVMRSPPAYPRKESQKAKPKHNNRASYLVKILERRQSWLVTTNSGKTELCELQYYQWTKECDQILSSRGTIRHDVFGASPSLKMSPSRPTVAIEVVISHWPEPEVFEDLIAHSRRSPAICLFDYSNDNPNEGWPLLSIDHKAGTIGVVLYIAEGELKKDGRTCLTIDTQNKSRRKATTSEDLKCEAVLAAGRFGLGKV